MESRRLTSTRLTSGDTFHAGAEADACGPLVRREFWTGFKWYMEAHSCVNCARVTTDGWMWHNTDLTTGNFLSFVRARLGDIGVKYTLNDSNAETVYTFIRRHRRQIEAAFDIRLEWRGGGDDGSGIIEARRPMGSFQKESWSAHYVWLQRQLETFRQSLLPLVGRIPPKGETSSWNESLFMRELEMWNPACLLPARRLLDWATPPDASATWGRGHACGSFAETVCRNGVVYQLASLRTDGTFSLLFTQLKRTPLFEDRGSRLTLLERVNAVPGIHFGESVVDSRPSLPLAILADESVCSAFIGVLDWFKSSVRAGRLA
jgi:hypothetical protein